MCKARVGEAGDDEELRTLRNACGVARLESRAMVVRFFEAGDSKAALRALEKVAGCWRRGAGPFKPGGKRGNA